MKLPSSSTVIAVTALCVALGGTAVAQQIISGDDIEAGTIGPAALAKSSVTAPAIAPGAVTGPKLRAGAVTNRALARNAVTLNNIAPGARGITTVFTRSTRAAVPMNTQRSVTATCPRGYVAMTGGYSGLPPTPQVNNSNTQAVALSSRPNPMSGKPTGWTVTVFNGSQDRANLTVYVVCAE